MFWQRLLRFSRGNFEGIYVVPVIEDNSRSFKFLKRVKSIAERGRENYRAV